MRYCSFDEKGTFVTAVVTSIVGKEKPDESRIDFEPGEAKIGDIEITHSEPWGFLAPNEGLIIVSDEATIGWKWTNDDGLIAPLFVSGPVPNSVTPWQMRKACRVANLFSIIDGLVKNSNNDDLKDAWGGYAVSLVRDSPEIALMMAALSQVPEAAEAIAKLGDTPDKAADQLFRNAGSYL